MRRRHGFTFIEVLVAMLIFVMAVLAAVDIVHGSVRATRDARQVTIATQLLQNILVDLETKLETDGFDKACEKKKEGKFEAPHEGFNWIASCNEIEFNLSQTAAQMAAAEQDGETEQRANENQLLKLILDTASQYMSKAIRELHVEVFWTEGKDKRTIDVTTHLARYDQPFSMPGIPSLPSGSGGGGT